MRCEFYIDQMSTFVLKRIKIMTKMYQLKSILIVSPSQMKGTTLIEGYNVKLYLWQI